jgi:N-hydroxyarylamine O-acetyltransferase
MTLASILSRIQYTGPRQATLETLTAVTHQFLYTIPFENLDIHLGRPIRMELPHLYEKIVTHRRGGFCYESNVLFADLLTRLGFDVTLLSARMVFGEVVLPEFVHVTLLVKLDQHYVVDVGNGPSFRKPLPLDGSDTDTSEGKEFIIGQDQGEHALFFRRSSDAPWEKRFLFTLRPRAVSDFQAMCHETQISPDSFFVQHRLATLATPTGRRTLVDQTFALEHLGQRVEQPVSSEAHFHQLLREHHGIDLQGASLNWKPVERHPLIEI